MSDITFRKHRNNPASNAAFERAEPHTSRTREVIYAYICAHSGVTSADIQAHLRKMLPHADNWPINAFSGRISELKADRLVDTTAELRGGRQVLVRYEQQRLLVA